MAAVHGDPVNFRKNAKITLAETRKVTSFLAEIKDMSLSLAEQVFEGRPEEHSSLCQ
jgi:hypothetical protein